MEKVAIIGGSGINDAPTFQGVEWKCLETNVLNGYGDGKIWYQENREVVFIPRHGGHPESNPRYSPSRTQYAANLVAAKMLGAQFVIGMSAVGSLRPDSIGIGSLVIPDDYIDESGRDDNIFEKGIVIHANPRPAFSPSLREILLGCAKEMKDQFPEIHEEAVYVTIPGDRFGTAAEGKKRALYAHVVGMTGCPEAAMAVQLNLHYALVAFPVDVDSDANHEGQTLEVMRRLSSSEKVPAYVDRVIKRVLKLEPTLLPQLKGNIIPGDLNLIENVVLRQAASELIEMYCRG